MFCVVGVQVEVVTLIILALTKCFFVGIQVEVVTLIFPALLNVLCGSLPVHPPHRTFSKAGNIRVTTSTCTPTKKNI